MKSVKVDLCTKRLGKPLSYMLSKYSNQNNYLLYQVIMLVALKKFYQNIVMVK